MGITGETKWSLKPLVPSTTPSPLPFHLFQFIWGKVKNVRLEEKTISNYRGIVRNGNIANTVQLAGRVAVWCLLSVGIWWVGCGVSGLTASDGEWRRVTATATAMGGRLGACLAQPVTDKVNEAGAGNGLRYGVSSMQGWRADMEDAHAALLQIEGPGPGPPPRSPQSPQTPPNDCAFFGVFDGHAGGGAAAHCAAHLLDSVRRTDDWANGRPGILNFSPSALSLSFSQYFITNVTNKSDSPSPTPTICKSKTQSFYLSVFCIHSLDSRMYLRKYT